MKLKNILLTCLTLILTFLLGACSSNVSDPSLDNWSKYEEKKQITIGFDNTFVPVSYTHLLSPHPSLLAK